MSPTTSRRVNCSIIVSGIEISSEIVSSDISEGNTLDVERHLLS